MALTKIETTGILHQSILAMTDNTLIATVPVDRFYIRNVLSFSNSSDSTSASVEIYLVPPEDSTITNKHLYLPATLVPSLVALDVLIPHDISAGWKIYVKASVANIS